MRYELEIRERIVRVEEELKHQRELMLQGFKMNKERSEELRADMNKRFEQIDKHLIIAWIWSLSLTISTVIAIVKLT